MGTFWSPNLQKFFNMGNSWRLQLPPSPSPLLTDDYHDYSIHSNFKKQLFTKFEFSSKGE